MAKFSDILKGTGQWLTLEGRNLGQLTKNLVLASRVKRVRPEDYANKEEFQKALKKSQGAYESLQSELRTPTANKILNELLSISPEQQQRQSASQLYGITKENPQGTIFSPELFKTTANLASKLPIPGLGLAGSIAVGGAQAGAGGLGMSDPGKELESTLTAIPFGMAGGAAAYGLSKLGQALLNKTRVIPPKTAGKKATLDWGFKAKDIEKVGGWEEAQKVATDLYSDAQELGLKTTTRYDKANAIATIKDALNADVSTMVQSFDKAGKPAVSANSVIGAIKNNNRLSLALSKDPGTAEWLYSTISGFADDSGNLSMSSVKELMSTLVDTAGGLKGTVGDQANLQRQILTAGRGALRDVVSKVSPPISNAMTKLYNYIQISPSVTGQVVKQAKLPIPAVNIPTGTLGAEVSDVLSGVLGLSGKGRQGAVTTPYAGIGNVLETIGQVGQAIPGAIGGLIGGIPRQEQTTMQEVPQLREDDEGLQMIRSAFEQPQIQPSRGIQGIGGQEMNAVNLMLAQGILNGQISATEANAVLSLLGMEQPEAKKMTATEKNRLYELNTAEADLQNISKILDEYTGASGPVAGGISKYIPSSKARKINAELGRLTQSIATGLEKGKLSDQDREFYKTITPQVSDTASEREYKINSLLSAIRRNMTTFQDVYGGGYSETDALSEMLGL